MKPSTPSASQRPRALSRGSGHECLHLPPFTRLPALVLLLAGFCAGTTAAKDIYVATNGTASAPYATWATALPDVQRALNYASPGDTIYLAGQTFAKFADFGAVFTWKNAKGVTVRGGYEASPALPLADHPGARNATTVWTLADGVGRVLTMDSLSNCVLEQVTLCGGANTDLGVGVQITNCWNVTLANCCISNNVHRGVYSKPCGGGLAVWKSTVVLTNTAITDNRTTPGGGVPVFGAGLYVDPDSVVRATRCRIERNSVTTGGGDGGGGGGGGFFNQGTLELYETVLLNNISGNPDYGFGAAGRNSGRLLLRNCLVAKNKDLHAISDGIHLGGGSATFVNCTIVDNHGVGLYYAGGYVAMTNCIVRGHARADLLSFPKDRYGVMPNVWYSSIGDGQNNGWQGCLTADPLFADSVYYHLQSTAGCYDNGFFTGGAWSNSAATSPLIDRGFPSPNNYSREPEPNGGWLNIGAYGHTEVASKSSVTAAVLPAVVNRGAAEVGHRTAVLSGEVPAVHGKIPRCGFLYWVRGSAITNAMVAGNLSGAFHCRLFSLTPGATYQYVVTAASAAGEARSEVATFTTHPTPSFLYVATNGNSTAGTNWSTAYASVSMALNLAEAGDTVCLAGQTFAGGCAGTVPAHPDNAMLVWRQATNITLRGGYTATTGGGDQPGAQTAGSTILRRTEGGGVRVLTLSGITNCRIENVTMCDGNTARPGGFGVYLTNCWDVTFADCVVSNNGGRAGNVYGLGMYLQDSSVVLTNTLVANNYSMGQTWYVYGGGVYVDSGSRLTAIRSSFVRNGLSESEGNGSSGVGLSVARGGVLEMYESVVSGNAGGHATYGGGIFNEGRLRMRNCLVFSNTCLRADSADGIVLAAGTGTFLNCTFANNGKIGLGYGGGVAALTNCIIWGHSIADLTNFPKNVAGVLNNVAYSTFAIPATMQGVNGCLNQSPLFVNAAANDYRLQETPCSPCINKGENQPWMANATDLDHAPRVQGGTVDMGAFEYTPNPPTIRHSFVTNLTAKSATVGAEIVSVGGSAAVAVLLFHGPADGGTDPQAWASQNRLPVLRTVGPLTAPIPAGNTNTLYFYRFCASNSFGLGWAAATGVILSGVVEAGVTRRESTEEKPAAFVISRPATAKNGPLSVYFTLGGNGVNGADYEPLESPAVIPKGAAEVRLPVVPKFNFGDQQPKSVELTLAPGGYVIGVKKNARILTRAE